MPKSKAGKILYLCVLIVAATGLAITLITQSPIRLEAQKAPFTPPTYRTLFDGSYKDDRPSVLKMVDGDNVCYVAVYYNRSASISCVTR
jgi:hypothetical protein